MIEIEMPCEKMFPCCGEFICALAVRKAGHGMFRHRRENYLELFLPKNRRAEAILLFMTGQARK